jgi:predicted nuclease with TOPRIM domain
MLLSTVSALAAAVFALIAMLAARRCNALLNEVTQLATALSRERGAIAALEANNAALAEAFRKLSGRVAAVKRWDQDNHGDPRRTNDSERSDVLSANSDLAAKAAWKSRMREKYLLPRQGGE